MGRATLTYDLTAKVSKRDQAELDKLLVAGMLDRGEEVRDRMKRPAIQRLAKRGVVKLSRGRLVDAD